MHATVLQFGQHREPELGSLALGEPHAQQVFLSVQVNCQHQVEGFVDDALVLGHRD